MHMGSSVTAKKTCFMPNAKPDRTLLVKVMARTRSASTFQCQMRLSTRDTSARVLPLPGPAWGGGLHVERREQVAGRAARRNCAWGMHIIGAARQSRRE